MHYTSKQLYYYTIVNEFKPVNIQLQPSCTIAKYDVMRVMKCQNTLSSMQSDQILNWRMQ